MVPSFISILSLCTESYILALTNAAQTDLDSLSASEIVLKQFKEDRSHIKSYTGAQTMLATSLHMQHHKSKR